MTDLHGFPPAKISINDKKRSQSSIGSFSDEESLETRSNYSIISYASSSRSFPSHRNANISRKRQRIFLRPSLRCNNNKPFNRRSKSRSRSSSREGDSVSSILPSSSNWNKRRRDVSSASTIASSVNSRDSSYCSRLSTTSSSASLPHTTAAATTAATTSENKSSANTLSPHHSDRSSHRFNYKYSGTSPQSPTSSSCQDVDKLYEESQYERLPLEYWERSEACKNAKFDHLDRLDRIWPNREALVLLTTLSEEDVVLEPNMFPYETPTGVQHYTLWSVFDMTHDQICRFVDHWLRTRLPHVRRWDYDDNSGDRSIDLFHVHVFIETIPYSFTPEDGAKTYRPTHAVYK